jgi:molecular chaperone DnaK (HSP70)
MVFQNVKSQIISLLNGEDNESMHCVISVPFYYTLIERELLMKCCKASGLKCLNLFNDTTSSEFFLICLN